MERITEDNKKYTQDYLNILESYINTFEYTTEMELDLNKVEYVRVEIENKLNNLNEELSDELALKVFYLLGLARKRTKMYEESINAIFEALKYANLLNDRYYTARGHALLAINCLILDRIDEFKEHYKIAEKLLKKINKYEDLVQLDTRISVYTFRKGLKDEEIKRYLEKALYNIDKFHSQLSPQLYVLIASMYSLAFGNYKLAIDLYLKALDIAKYYNNIAMDALILYYIGTGYTDLRMREEAIEVFYDILKDSRFLKFTTIRVSAAFDLISTILEENGDLNTVAELLKHCQEEIEKIDVFKKEQYKMQLDLLRVQYNIASNDNKIEDSIIILERSKNIYKKHRENCIFVYIDYFIDFLYGDVYYKMGDFSRAAEHHNKALNISKKYTEQYTIKSYKSLSKDYEALGDYKKAYESVVELNKNIMNVENTNLREKYISVQKSYEELKWVEKEREQFFSNLSHELKTPINIIYSSTQLMNLFKDKSDKSFKEYYLKHEKSVRINCLRMLKIIRNMIDMNKIDCEAMKPNFANYNIVNLIEEITMSVLSYVELKNINIIFDTDEEEIIIKCDAYMIERIILNLLSNAIKFSKEKGNISVKIHTENNYVVVKVIDDGIGIPSNMQDVIFNKFVQIDKTFNRKNEGSGIGLSLVKSLLDIHNGDIELKSMEGIGSEFKILLPNIKVNEIEDTKVNNYDIDKDRVFSELSDIYEL